MDGRLSLLIDTRCTLLTITAWCTAFAEMTCRSTCNQQTGRRSRKHRAPRYPVANVLPYPTLTLPHPYPYIYPYRYQS